MEHSPQIRICVTSEDGANAEMLESAATSLLNELNAHRRGAANFAPSPPPELQAGRNEKTVFGMSAEIVVASAGVAAAWVAPAVQVWLASQRKDIGATFTLKNEAGEDYVVKIGANAPPEVVAKLSNAIVRAKKA